MLDELGSLVHIVMIINIIMKDITRIIFTGNMRSGKRALFVDMATVIMILTQMNEQTKIEAFEALIESQINGNISWSLEYFDKLRSEYKRDFINWLWNNNYKDKVLWFCSKYFENRI